MEQQLDHIHVFKSDISTDSDSYRISVALDAHPQIRKWSIDLEDNDRVLRVESSTLKQKHIIDLVERCGYHCEELPDQ